MTRTAVLDYEVVVPIFPQGLAFLAWGHFHALAFRSFAPLSLRKNGNYSQSTAVPADQTTYDPKRLRWNREQECENYGAEKDNQGKDDREKGSDINMTTTNKANCGKSIEAIYAT